MAIAIAPPQKQKPNQKQKKKKKKKKNIAKSPNEIHDLFVSLSCQEQQWINAGIKIYVCVCVCMCLHVVSQFHFGQMPINYFLFSFNKFHSYLRYFHVMAVCVVYTDTRIVLTNHFLLAFVRCRCLIHFKWCSIIIISIQ